MTDKMVAIIWPNSAELALADSDAFDTAVAILAHIAQIFSDKNATGGDTKMVAVIIA